MVEPLKLPEHVEQTVQAIADVHNRHYRATGRLQRWADLLTAMLGRPASVLLLGGVALGWLVFNLGAPQLGIRTLDPPPFAGLELVATLSALFLAALILVTQRRDDVLAEQRSHLMLELALVSEQKTAKLIALIEELRRDLPSVTDRVDDVSEAMSRAVDPQTVLDAVEAKSDRTTKKP